MQPFRPRLLAAPLFGRYAGRQGRASGAPAGAAATGRWRGLTMTRCTALTETGTVLSPSRQKNSAWASQELGVGPPISSASTCDRPRVRHAAMDRQAGRPVA